MADVDVVIELPYGLTVDQLAIDSRAEQRPNHLGRLLIELSDWNEDELRRVFTSVACFQSAWPDARFVSILETAMIWERG